MTVFFRENSYQQHGWSKLIDLVQPQRSRQNARSSRLSGLSLFSTVVLLFPLFLGCGPSESDRAAAADTVRRSEEESTKLRDERDDLLQSVQAIDAELQTLEDAVEKIDGPAGFRFEPFVFPELESVIERIRFGGEGWDLPVPGSEALGDGRETSSDDPDDLSAAGNAGALDSADVQSRDGEVEPENLRVCTRFLRAEAIPIGPCGEGALVKTFQVQLNLALTGKFDRAMQLEVAAYRAKLGLSYVALIDADLMLAANLSVLPTESCDGEYSFSNTPPITVCSRGPTVKAVQERLGLDADGYFGPGTQRELLAYQRRAGLAQTGQIDTSTLRSLDLAQ